MTEQPDDPTDPPEPNSDVLRKSILAEAMGLTGRLLHADVEGYLHPRAAAEMADQARWIAERLDMLGQRRNGG